MSSRCTVYHIPGEGSIALHWPAGRMISVSCQRCAAPLRAREPALRFAGQLSRPAVVVSAAPLGLSNKIFGAVPRRFSNSKTELYGPRLTAHDSWPVTTRLSAQGFWSCLGLKRVDAAGHKACLLSSRLVCIHVSVLYSSASVLRYSSVLRRARPQHYATVAATCCE